MSSIDPIKVYDARWETDEFSDDSVRRLFDATFAYGRRLGVDTVTLARDSRLAAGHVLELAVDTAMRMGFRTFACPDAVSTPQSYFLTLSVSQEHPKTMGLTITASHNPKDYIGVKFTVPVVQAIGLDCGPEGGLTAVRRIYHSNEAFDPVSGGSLHLLNVQREYIDFSMRHAGVNDGDLAGISVVLDAFHGSAGPELFVALSRAGVEVDPLRLIPDGRFPTGSPNPTSRGKMDAAIERSRNRGFLVTIGVDGDGDRIVFGDGRGLLSAGFAAIPVLHESALRSTAAPTPVLYDPKVNPLALAEWARQNARPVLFRNGHSQIKDYMRRIGAVAAAEESGHYYHRITMGDLSVCCENSLLTILLFLRAIRSLPGTMDDLWKLQQSICTTGEFNYRFPDDTTRDGAMAAVIRHFADEGASTVTATQDGIDLEGTVLSKGVGLDDGRVTLAPEWYSGYLRVATNEKSVVRSYFSTGSPSALNRIESLTRQILERSFAGRTVE